MPGDVRFKETQKIRHLWIWLALIALSIASLLFFYKIYYYGYTETTADYIFNIFMPSIPFFIIILLLIIRLDTEVNQSGIYYQYFPFHLKRRKIEWSEIEKAYVRQYHPVKEYGGFGIRGITKKNRAYSVSGKYGLQILFKNKNRLLIGTQRSIELEEVIYELHEKTYLQSHK